MVTLIDKVNMMRFGKGFGQGKPIVGRTKKTMKYDHRLPAARLSKEQFHSAKIGVKIIRDIFVRDQPWKAPRLAFIFMAMELSNGTYHIQGVTINSLCEEFGTPLYVYDGAKIIDQLKSLKNAFSETDVRIKFAAKALTNIAILDRKSVV